MSLLDGSHVYLAPSEDKTGTFEREGKSVGFSQRATQQGPWGGFKSWGWGRQGSWQGKDRASVTGKAVNQKGHTCSTTTMSTLQRAPHRFLQMNLEKSHDETFLCYPNSYQSTWHIDCTQNAPERTNFPNKQKNRGRPNGGFSHRWQHSDMFYVFSKWGGSSLASQLKALTVIYVIRVSDSNDNICCNCLISLFFKEGRYSTDQLSLFNHRGDRIISSSIFTNVHM